MKLLDSFKTNWLSKFKNNSPEIYIDLGSLNTRIYYQNKVIYFEPSCLALHQKTKQIVSIGKKAQKLEGKLPKSIELIYPIFKGKIAHKKLASLYLEAIINKVLKNKKSLFFKINAELASAQNTSPLQKKIFREVFEQANISLNRIINKADCMLNYLNQNNLSYQCMIDMGYELTEIAVFTQEECIHSQTVQFGGHKLIALIQQVVRNKYALEISKAVAQQILCTVLRVPTQNKGKSQDKKYKIVGKNLVDQSVKELKVQSSDFDTELEYSLNELIDDIQAVFFELESDLVVDAFRNGIYLTGGLSQLSQMDKYLQHKFETKVAKSKEPQIDLVKGIQ